MLIARHPGVTNMYSLTAGGSARALRDSSPRIVLLPDLRNACSPPGSGSTLPVHAEEYSLFRHGVRTPPASASAPVARGLRISEASGPSSEAGRKTLPARATR